MQEDEVVVSMQAQPDEPQLVFGFRQGSSCHLPELEARARVVGYVHQRQLLVSAKPRSIRMGPRNA